MGSSLFNDYALQIIMNIYICFPNDMLFSASYTGKINYTDVILLKFSLSLCAHKHTFQTHLGEFAQNLKNVSLKKLIP